MNYELWAKHITTPYLPAVGLVHADCVRPETLRAVTKSLTTGIRPAFDKSLRWDKQHQERLADEWFMQADNATIIYTARNAVLTAYIFTHSEEAINSLLKEARTRGAKKIYTLSRAAQSKDAHISHVFLGEVRKNDGKSEHARPVMRDGRELKALVQLDNGKEMAGLAFLASQIAKRDDLGPTLGYFIKTKLVGAIGPLDVRCDAIGRKYLLPPYFGVHASMRGKGAGRELWNAAMNYGAEQGAEYILVQAEDGAESVGFYEQAKLVQLGFVVIKRFQE